MEPDAPFVVGVRARQDFDQGAFPRAVLSRQYVDLAGFKIEVHVIQHLDARETLSDAHHSEHVPILSFGWTAFSVDYGGNPAGRE